MTLINKTLAAAPDQDTYYDLVDPLEELGIESIIKKCSSLDTQLREQFELYEQVLKTEDQDSSPTEFNGQNDLKSQNKMLANNEDSRGSNSSSSSGGSQKVDELRRKSKRAERQQVDDDGQQQVGEDASNDLLSDDNYVTANESNESSKSTIPLIEEPRKSFRQRAPEQEEPAARKGNVIKQNLARGKQQRASISSCSSSDSYASYGSGYASGSGNSTDHEHKQRSLANTNEEADQLAAVEAKTNKLKDSDADVNDNDNQDGDEDDSQLRQHLSELEQLTDELASRNIFGNLTQPIQSTSKHLSSTIKSTSSNSSSILSTASDISSCLSGPPSSTTNESLAARCAQVPPPPPPPNSESRSTSTTPTALTLSAQSSTNAASASLLSTSLSSSLQQQAAHYENESNIANNTGASLKAKPRPPHQYSLQASPNNVATQQKQQQQAPQTSSSSSSSKQEPYYHNLFQWEQLVSKGVTRPLLINDLDFTDLRDEDDCDLMNSSSNLSSRARNQATGEPLTINIPEAHQLIENSAANSNGQDSIDSGTGTGSPKTRDAQLQPPSTPASAPPPMPPPPISPWFNTISGSRPQSQFMSSPSPPYEHTGVSGEFNRDQSPANSTYSNYSRNSVCVAQTSTPLRDSTTKLINQHQYNTLQPLTSLRSASSMSSLLFGNNSKYGAYKRKKTMKLFWKEVREDRSLLSKLTKKRTIWDEIKPVQVDTQKLEHLFESKAKDLLLSKSRNGLDGLNQRKVKITVLDAKRSNAINIGMTKLPPMRTIKSAILKMDSSIMNREGIEKILTTMMPSEEEKSRIIEAQLANPDTPLGTAEQFLLNLASISALEARLKLWAFQLDYAQIEKEVAEPLMDLKQAIEEIERSETFRIILGALLAIGNFLNSTNVKGFQIDYLEKVPEVKDTVHKHSLLHHLCLFIQEKYGVDSTSDLYSEFSAVNRASKVDYTEVAKNLKKMQLDCKASWDYLKIVAKHDGLANLMNTCSSNTSSSSGSSAENGLSGSHQQHQPKSSGKLNNLSKLSMITTVMSTESGASSSSVSCSSNGDSSSGGTSKQLKTKVSDFLTDCAERIMVLMVIHRRVMNRFQKLLVYLGCPSHQIKQTQPQQILKIINEFALEYRTKRERVREMLLKKSHCQHHNHNHQRWQLNRSSRWAGSQQCLDSLGYNHSLNRPCSTTSSCASSYATNQTCTDYSMCCSISLAGDRVQNHHHANNQQQHQQQVVTGINRANSPSGFSQISNYSDYMFDQTSSCCDSRQQSITPVPSEHLIRRPHSMSISMFDLQNQQQQQNQQQGSLQSNKTVIGGNNATSCNAALTTASNRIEGPVNNSINGNQGDQLARQKDEQLRLLLGAGKSFDETCNEFYQMSHWSSTMARVHRHPPIVHGSKQRANSMDSPNKDDEFDASRQSSYYRHLHNNGRSNSDDHDGHEQNSDDEILQSLVRTATAKRTHNSQNGNRSANNSAVNRVAKNKILTRFNCDRKSCK